MFKKFLLFSSALFFSFGVYADIYSVKQAFENGSYKEILPELETLSREGDAKAKYYLGVMYYEGLGVEQNTEIATSYLQDSFDNNVLDAGYYLSKILLEQSSPSKEEIEQAIDYTKKAAFAGNAGALYTLGKMHLDGEIVPKNYNHAYGYFLMAALKGDKKSQKELAELYMDGRGITHNLQQAVTWMTRSANQGYVPAQQELASWFDTLKKIKSPEKAYIWYSIIAAYNSDTVGEEAQMRRDLIFNTLDKNTDVFAAQRKAKSWRPIAANKSVPLEEILNTPTPLIPGFNDNETKYESIMPDGDRYGITETMIKEAKQRDNFDRIEKQANQAIKLRNMEVFAYMGLLYAKVFNNPEKALEWYKMGSEAGVPYAQYLLAEALCAGKGLEVPDPGMCYGWLLVAQDKASYALSQQINNAIESVLKVATPSEVKAGEAFAKKQIASPDKKAGSAFSADDLF